MQKKERGDYLPWLINNKPALSLVSHEADPICPGRKEGSLSHQSNITNTCAHSPGPRFILTSMTLCWALSPGRLVALPSSSRNSSPIYPLGRQVWASRWLEWQRWEPVLKWALASLQQHTNPQVRAGQQSSSLKYSQSTKNIPRPGAHLGSDVACNKFPNLWILSVWITHSWAQFYIKTYIVQHCYADFGFVTTRQGDSLGQKLCYFLPLFFLSKCQTL